MTKQEIEDMIAEALDSAWVDGFTHHSLAEYKLLVFSPKDKAKELAEKIMEDRK